LLIVTGDSTTGTAGRRGGARQSHRADVRAQDVEKALMERKPGAAADVGGRRDDQRTLAADEIAERRAVEQDFVVELRGELGTAPAF
jgi:hypothetical protein